MNTSALSLLLSSLLLTAGCAHKQWAQAMDGERSIEVRAGEGAGNVTLGMSKAKVKRRLGEPAMVDDTSMGLYWTYPKLGMSVKFDGRELDALYCYSGIPGGFETRAYEPFPGATSEGITVHSAQREVLETYGRPAKWDSNDRAPIPAVWMTYSSGLGFCFTERSQQMVYFYVD